MKKTAHSITYKNLCFFRWYVIETVKFCPGGFLTKSWRFFRSKEPIERTNFFTFSLWILSVRNEKLSRCFVEKI